jgi:hypothetical protein
MQGEPAMAFNFEHEMILIVEAWCVENNLPIKRRFTHVELEQSIERVREAAELLKADSFRAIRQVNAEREGKP